MREKTLIKYPKEQSDDQIRTEEDKQTYYRKTNVRKQKNRKKL